MIGLDDRLLEDSAHVLDEARVRLQVFRAGKQMHEYQLRSALLIGLLVEVDGLFGVAETRLSFEVAKETFTQWRWLSQNARRAALEDEDRFVAIGPIRIGVIVVIYTEPTEDDIRIISARRATNRETALYQQYYGETDE